MRDVFARRLLFAILVLAFVGITVVGGRCGQVVVHRAVGTASCPATFVHHLAMFLAAFSAIAVAMIAFVTAIAAGGRPPKADPRVCADVRFRFAYDTISRSPLQELFRRGILHRREAPASSF